MVLIYRTRPWNICCWSHC